jgi:hypothetical protein
VPNYVNFLQAGVISRTGSERSGVTLTIIKAPWEPQHHPENLYSEITFKINSSWRIPEVKTKDRRKVQEINLIIFRK